MNNNDVVILGVGMHPWGKWEDGEFYNYGVKAATDALKDADVKWRDIQYMVASETWFAGVDGLLAASTFAEALGWSGIPVISTFNACASGGYSLDVGRTMILSGKYDLVLCMGAEKNPKGFFPPLPSLSKRDLDGLRFNAVGATNPTFFALEAKRRMELYGTTEEDLSLVKVKNSRHGKHNPYARYQREFTMEDVLNSPMVASPLRLLMLPATSHGAAAIVLASKKAAKKHTSKPVFLSSVATLSPDYPDVDLHLRLASNSTKNISKPEHRIEERVCLKTYEEAGVGPEDIDLAELYDLGTNFELDYMEFAGLCKYGQAEQLLRKGETTIGGKIPVNTSGGLSSFGEAIPAQGLQQVCELVWQLRGEAGARQVEGAKVGLTMNFGLQGNCSACIVKV